MNRLVILSGMLLFCLFVGCNKQNEGVNFTSTIEVKAQKNSVSAVKSLAEQSKDVETQTVFTSNDIISYNGKTGEIVFQALGNNETIGTILQRFNDKLDFYKNGELLFSLKSKIVMDIESVVYNEPLLHYTTLDGNKCFIRDGYPWGVPIDATIRNGSGGLAEEREANAKKIIDGWKIFIDELKKENKYIKN